MALLLMYTHTSYSEKFCYLNFPFGSTYFLRNVGDMGTAAMCRSTTIALLSPHCSDVTVSLNSL